MALPSEWEGRTAQQLPPQLRLEEEASAGSNAATLRGGRARASSSRGAPTAVVDLREFRSALPNMLQLHGVTLRPATLEAGRDGCRGEALLTRRRCEQATLEVGDYVLAPDLVVERKALPDLVQSLASGRLYNQAEAMLRTRAELAADLSPNSTTSKLCLLLLHFPKLRLLWSRRPLHTIAIFDALKRGAPEPDVDKAAAIGTHAEQAAGQLFNMTPQDLLRSMPGVHAHNYRRLMNAVTNMHELSQLSLGRLAELLGEQNARRLHTFLHQSA